MFIANPRISTLVRQTRFLHLNASSSLPLDFLEDRFIHVGCVSSESIGEQHVLKVQTLTMQGKSNINKKLHANSPPTLPQPPPLHRR
jgi:hypothetical protein